MSTFKGFVLRDLEDGRIDVFDSVDKFSAKFEDGSWKRGGFTLDDLKENFTDVRDEAEANTILKEAKAALSV